MTNSNQIGRAGQIAEYDGSPHQSDALRAIAMDAFQLDTYSESSVIQERLDRNHHRVWLVNTEDGSLPAGFLATFPTDSLAGRRIEFDLLAVRTGAQGQGLAGRLMQTALDHWRSSGAGPARALIRRENGASKRVFQRAGFAPADWEGELLIGQAVKGEITVTEDALTIRPADEHDLPDLRRHWPAIFGKGGSVESESLLESSGPPGVASGSLPDICMTASTAAYSWSCRNSRSDPPPAFCIPGLSLLQRDDFGLLVAEDDSGICGFAELLAVHTIPYSGVWVENLEAVGDDASVILALTEAARRWAAGWGLGQAGAVIDLARELVRNRLRDAGYHSAGIYRHFHLSAIEGDLS